LGVEDKHQQQRHDQHHHPRIADRIVEHIQRCPQCLQRRAREQAAKHRRNQPHQCAQGQRGAGNRLDHARFLGTPGLADQYRRASAQADHQGNEKEHDGKHPRDRCQRLGTEHLPDIDAIEGAGKALQEVGQHHGCEKDQVDLPQRALQRALHEKRGLGSQKRSRVIP